MIETRLRWHPRLMPVHAARALSLSACLSALVPLACTDDGGSEAETEGQTETETQGAELGACVEPGSVLFPESRPPLAPSEVGDPEFDCSSGWGSDAPAREAAWSVRLPELQTNDFSGAPLLVTAHPETGAIVHGDGYVNHYDGAGELQWSLDALSWVRIAAEASGTLLIWTYDHNSASGSLKRYGGDGIELEDIEVPWNSPSAQLYDLSTFGDNIVIGAIDTGSEGELEETLLYLDPSGNELLRRSTNSFDTPTVVVNQNGSVAFGSSPAFLVALEDGALLGQLSPSQSFFTTLAGEGEGFVGAMPGVDFTVERYDSSGGAQWLTQYDRAGLADSARAVDARDGLIVAVGVTSSLNYEQVYWYSFQPLVIAMDSQGEAQWVDRIAAMGEAMDVAIGEDGIYVTGVGERDEEQDDALEMWLRKY